MENQFKAGDTVCLKSDKTVKYIVEAVHTTRIICLYINKSTHNIESTKAFESSFFMKAEG